jgi:hypothetical protein
MFVTNFSDGTKLKMNLIPGPLMKIVTMDRIRSLQEFSCTEITPCTFQ